MSPITGGHKNQMTLIMMNGHRLCYKHNVGSEFIVNIIYVHLTMFMLTKSLI